MRSRSDGSAEMPAPSYFGELHQRFSFFSRDKKRLANTQRNVRIHETFGQWANCHRDDGYTEQGQEALQHLHLPAMPWLVLSPATFSPGPCHGGPSSCSPSVFLGT
ncbi:RILPL1 [Cervus elaphus hippelaphus]|uniref:RILPL1 n=1 Tax=Cervus elaphus hippelaphus TaxID=46360 RepID=A0A212DAU8_CEREH|nr:RILPL1 [Cervus elaphus hippelaphus]